MAWCAKLGGQLTVVRDGLVLGPPPTRLAAVLLIGLLSRQSEWVARRTAANRLYPAEDESQARQALRQTLHRLREWLGAEAIEATADHLRVDGQWSIDLMLPDGKAATFGLIASELDHEWIDEVRLNWSRDAVNQLGDADKAFFDLILSTAVLDPDAARAMLPMGRPNLCRFDPSTLAQVLTATRPANPDAPFAAAYYEIRGMYEGASCNFRIAIQFLEKAFRIATAQGQHKDANRAAGHLLYCHIECGDEAAANVWSSRLRHSPWNALFSNGAIASEMWNRNDHAGAIEFMLSSEHLLKSAAREERLHFWSNLSILAAEASDTTTSRKAADACLGEQLTSADSYWQRTLKHSLGWRALRRSDGEEAMVNLTDESNSPWVLTRLYSNEVHALLHAIRQNRSAALRCWSASTATLSTGGAGLNPRRKALRAQIRSLLA